MHLTKKLVLLLAALALTVGLAACGSSDDTNDTTGTAETTSTGGEEAVTGTFEPIAGVPQPYGDVSGEAELTRADGKTITAISLEGLVADTKYIAHLHTGGCGETDPGGPHFKFNPQGGDEPPNEIHLSFTSNADGSGKAKVTADQEVPVGEAGSIVVHTDGDAMTASTATQQFASLFIHEGEEHEGDDHGDHDSGGEPGHDGGGIQPLSAKVACAELEGSSAETAEGPVPTIEVKGGEPVDGIQDLEFDAGEQIRFKVSGDEAEEIHVHGYDLSEEIPQGGGTVEFDFPAEIEGIFEIELEEQAVQIAELQVNP